MQKFYSDYNQMKTRQVKELLDEANIPCMLKNEYIQGASGEIPPHETLLEVWLLDASWTDKAKKLLLQFEQDLSDQSDWFCETCKEYNEAQFKVCWKCQSPQI